MIKRILATIAIAAPLLVAGSASALSKAGTGNCAGYPNGKCESNPNQGQLTKDVGAFNVASSTQCKGDPTITVPAYGYKSLKVNNTNIALGVDADVIVTGNGNCITGANYDYISVTGNNNYVTAKGSATYLKGSNNFFQTQGNNYVNCGGSQAILDYWTDASTNCVVQ